MILSKISLLLYFSLIYIIGLLFLYFSKVRLKNIENRVYIWLLCLNIVGVALQICCDYVSVFYDEIPKAISITVLKLFLAYFIGWVNTMFDYLLAIVYKNKRKIVWINIAATLIEVIMVLLLPFELFRDPFNLVYYTYGPAVDFVYIMSGILIGIMSIFIILNFKKISKKKVLPIMIFFAFGGLSALIQKFYPGVVIIAPMETFICSLMYFTIENPDMKVVNELEIAKEQAEKANRAKTDFLSSMSHEIRTPLNAIVGFSEMMEQETDIEECKAEAKDIVMASHTLLEIVNGILDISKIEANKMEMVNKEYELMPELQRLTKLIIPRIGDKPLELKTKFAEDIPAVMYGDISKIKEIITNILTNAVKYTDEGYIYFEVNCINVKDQCSLVFKVSDTGRGIKKEQIDKLFNKFQRLDEDKNTTIEGTGLGLAITKLLVEMMGGKIVVNSEYGEGSTFTIYLKQKIVKMHQESKKKLYEDKDDYDFSGYKVLVVDDNSLNLKVATKLLSTYNIETETANSGFECIDKINDGNKYDLILLDDMMPRMKGTETLTRLKQDISYDIPTIALTANAITGMKEQYISLGFNDYLSKPIEKRELLRVLSKYLRKKHAEIIEEQQEEIVDKIDIDDITFSNEENKSSKKVLIVDDNKINIKIATKILEKYNFDLDSCLSGQECIEKVKEKKYDLIFMDHMMPVKNGIETFNELKKIDKFDTPVVALTADAIEGANEKFIQAGFTDYISKPIDRNILDDVIKKILG